MFSFHAKTDRYIDVTLTTGPSGCPQVGYLSQLVVAEVQVDQRVELAEASQLAQLVSSQAQGFDVAKTGVSSFQDPQTVI